MNAESERDVPVSAAELAAIAEWMRREGLGGGQFGAVELLSGGTQNIMLKVEVDGIPRVLRRGPAHLRPTTNKHLTREARILGALAGTDVPHARLVAFCDDPTVWSGSCFYLMDLVDGFNATVDLPPLHAGAPEIRREMGFSVVDALVGLGELNPTAIGLADVGRPDGFLARQVPQWLAEYDGYRRFDGYHEPAHDGVAIMADWLSVHLPPQGRPGLMHGDFHLANVMFSGTSPDVAAIIDWEMTTVADPLLDFGWLLCMWPENHGGAVGGVLGGAGGLPSEAELVARYAERSSRPLDHLDWYATMACFKLGVLLEGTYARACAKLAPMEVGEQLHATAFRLFEQGLRRIAAGPPS